MISQPMPESIAPLGVRANKWARIWETLESTCFQLYILPQILILALVPVYCIYLEAPATSVLHDDGLYIVTAQSLAHGTGYRIVSLPSEIPQTKYPILYPAILSAIVRMFPGFPQDLLLMKFISLISTILWCLACYQLFRDLGRGEWTWWILFFTLAFPWVIFLSSSVLPDTLFAFVSTWALVLLMRAAEKRDTHVTRNVIVGALLCGAAFLTRTTGIALILAAVVGLLWRRMYRHAAMFAGICAALCVPWLYWQALQPAPVDRVQTYYSKISYAQGAITGGYNLHQKWNVLVHNLLFLPASFAEAISPRYSALGLIAAILLWSVLLFGLVRNFRKNLTPLNVWAVCYLGVLLCWLWRPTRYEVPLMPLLFFMIAEGIRNTRVLSAPRRFRYRFITGALVLVCAGSVWLSVGKSTAETIRTHTPAARTGLEPVNWPDMMQLATWVRTNTPLDAIVSADLDPIFYLYGGRKAIRLFKSEPYELLYAPNSPQPLGSVEDLRAHLSRNKISYVVLTPHEGREEICFHELFGSLLLAYPQAFHLAKRLYDPEYVIYAVDYKRL